MMTTSLLFEPIDVTGIAKGLSRVFELRAEPKEKNEKHRETPAEPLPKTPKEFSTPQVQEKLRLAEKYGLIEGRRILDQTSVAMFMLDLTYACLIPSSDAFGKYVLWHPARVYFENPGNFPQLLSMHILRDGDIKDSDLMEHGLLEAFGNTHYNYPKYERVQRFIFPEFFD